LGRGQRRCPAPPRPSNAPDRQPTRYSGCALQLGGGRTCRRLTPRPARHRQRATCATATTVGQTVGAVAPRWDSRHRAVGSSTLSTALTSRWSSSPSTFRPTHRGSTFRATRWCNGILRTRFWERRGSGAFVRYPVPGFPSLHIFESIDPVDCPISCVSMHTLHTAGAYLHLHRVF
jgi:hypothetical protein